MKGTVSRACAAFLSLAVAAAGAAPRSQADNTLTPEERAAGWILLFNGGSPEGWKTSSGTPCRTRVEEGSLQPHGCGGYMLIHERQWSDFVLSLDYKLSPGCNSGVFVRTFPLTPRPDRDVGFNGLEIALDDTAPGTGYHDSGALYDLVRPRLNPQRPAGTWNHLEITCDGPRIAVVMNGQPVMEADLDRFTAPYLRPDGTPHKFDIAYKNHPRRGYIGLQDHGSPCWFKNIKIRPLP